MACSSCTYWSGPFMFEEGVSWAEPFSLHQCTSLLVQRRRLWLGGKRALHMRTPRYNCLYTGKSYFSNIRIFSCWLLEDQKLLVRRKCFLKMWAKIWFVKAHFAVIMRYHEIIIKVPICNFYFGYCIDIILVHLTPTFHPEFDSTVAQDHLSWTG